MRKPIQIEMAGMKTPRDRMWAAMRTLTEFDTYAVQKAAGRPWLEPKTIRDYIKALVGQGYLAQVEGQATDTKVNEVRFKVIKTVYETPRINKAGDKPTQGMATLAMWRAMKALKQFDYLDIQRAASIKGVCEVTPQTAKSYVGMLAKAGYFRTVKAHGPGVPAYYHLLRDTGPHAPAITRRKAVFDRNKGEFTWQQPEQEVCDDLQ